MTAEPKPRTRVVTVRRAEHPGWWAPPYFENLVGMRVKIPALVEGGRVLAGYLVAADESGADEIVLTFEDLNHDA